MDKSSRYLLIVVGLVAVAVVSVGVTYYSVKTKTALAPVVAPVVETPVVQQPAAPAPEPTILESGVSWLVEPQKLGDLKLIDASISLDGSTVRSPIEYYKIGTDNGKEVIIADVPPDDPTNDFLLYFVKQSDTSYDVLSSMTPSRFDDKGGFTYGGGGFASNVTINKEKKYSSIISPDYVAYTVPLDIVGEEYLSGAHLGDVKDVMKEVKTYPNGILYNTVASGDIESVVSQIFILKKLDGVLQQYQYTPRLYGDDSVLNATWAGASESNKDTYQYLNTRGCGMGGYVSIFADGKVPALKETGTLDWGDLHAYDNRSTIYEISDTNHPLLKNLYEQIPSNYGEMTYDLFLRSHSLVVIKDKLGRYLLLNNTKYGPSAECGKPVVYLYPTKTTQVSVSVDASITKSEPAYNDGWNVVAQPNGDLTMADGSHYDSLFWEGIGHGYYPTIDKGFVVARKDIETTLKSQLATMGLNKKESSDFLAFWLPKMPSTPYVRLSWLSTRDMNALAPLTVSPKPDTMIRIFLDFKGLESPVAIDPQILSAPARNGFTLVEWGGLLQK